MKTHTDDEPTDDFDLWAKALVSSLEVMGSNDDKELPLTTATSAKDLINEVEATTSESETTKGSS